jgi:hypothetical protein
VLLSCSVYYLYRDRIFHGCKYKTRILSDGMIFRILR